MSHPPPPPGPQDWQGQQGQPEWQGQPGQPDQQGQPDWTGTQDWQSQPGPAYGGYPTQPYGSGPETYGAPYGKPATSGKATTSLALGVASIVLCFIGFLLGIPAIIVGIRARKEIRESHGRRSGDGLALGGIITGIIGSLLGVLVIASVIGLVAFSTSVQDTVDQACDRASQDADPTNDCA
jgi:hypothetical protein